jgi:hypothetical protein
MFKPHHKNAERNHNGKIPNKYFQNVENLTYILEKSPIVSPFMKCTTDQIRGKAGFCIVQKFLSSPNLKHTN